MKKSYVAILAIIFFLIYGACSENKSEDKQKNIKHIKEYNLRAVEPSGLVISYDNKSLWTVSDNNGTISNISFDGKLIKELKTSARDLEGITVIDEKTLCVVQEAKRELLFVDINGKELRRHKVDFSGEKNSGFEGIAYNPKTKQYYIVNEKKPCQLIILNEKLEIEKSLKLKFSKDLSDIFYEPKENVLWITSDESKMVVKCDLQGNPIQKFKAPYDQIEGITVDKNNKYLYLVSDPLQRLYKFEFVK